jgi:Tol biopolymer transport system component/DNA-binding winged helix-turn-helix (wHTH) protein
MSTEINRFYEFDEFRIDVGERLLLRHGKDLMLPPKVFDVLLALVQNSGRIVEKEELMQMVWPDTFVEEVNLARNISDIRKALGDTRSNPRFIETIAKRGYRFTAKVQQPVNDSPLEEQEKSNVLPFATPANLLEVVQPSDAQPISPISGNLLLAPSINETPNAANSAPEESLQLLAPETASHIPAAALPLKNSGRPTWQWLVAALSMVSIISIVIAIYAFRQQQEASEPFRQMKITRLSATGKVKHATIAPDGKYIAYVLQESQGQSLWIQQVVTPSAVRIIEPTSAQYWGLTFSPDGNYVYYILFDGKNADPRLHEIPVLGGSPKTLPIVANGPVSFAPDGKKIAYTVSSSSSGGSILFTANLDGSDKKVLALVKDPDCIAIDHIGPAWSPDGKMIACSLTVADASGIHSKLVGVRLEDGKMLPLMAKPWAFVGQVSWLANSEELIFIGVEPNSSLDQIWHLSLTSGEVKRITNDLNENHGVSLTAEGKALLTVQDQQVSSFWILPDGDSGRAAKIPMDVESVRRMALTLDNKIVYSTTLAGNEGLRIVGLNGTDDRQLPVQSASNSGVAVSPDGKYLIVSSNHAGRLNLWRTGLDGKNPLRLTDGDGEGRPNFSADGKWVIYQKGFGNVHSTAWKVPIDGGESVQLTQSHTLNPNLSPDGSMLAYFFMDSSASPSTWRIGVIAYETKALLRTFDLPATFSSQALRWTPDGKALAYLKEAGSISNIWVQELDTDQPRQLTNFNSDRIVDFAWTRDGTQLICLRTVESSYIALINNFR